MTSRPIRSVAVLLGGLLAACSGAAGGGADADGRDAPGDDGAIEITPPAPPEILWLGVGEPPIEHGGRRS